MPTGLWSSEVILCNRTVYLFWFLHVVYRIAGNFRRRKFSRRKLLRIARSCRAKEHQISRRKLSRIATKPGICESFLPRKFPAIATVCELQYALAWMNLCTIMCWTLGMIWRYNRDCTHRAGGGHSLSLPSPRAQDITRLSTLHHHVPGPLLKIVHSPWKQVRLPYCMGLWTRLCMHVALDSEYHCTSAVCTL